MRQIGVRWMVLVGLALAMGVVVQAQANDGRPRVVESADGVPISYEVHGMGKPALVFIHGWSCDGRYWREQVSHFSQAHQVVIIDLAGHGHSGHERRDYTMTAFGEDVRAVAQDAGLDEVILIGHSMGGPVSVAAARLMPESVVGIIGVDTFQDVGEEISAEDRDTWMAPLREDFRRGAKASVPQMFIEETDAALRDWVVADMSAATPAVALSAMEEMLGDGISGDARTAFEDLKAPVVAINADLWPTDVQGNREHIPSFEAVIIEGTDHFLHMAVPDMFNRELEKVISDQM